MFENIEAYLLISDVNRFYFTQLHTSSGCVILTKDEKIFITDFRYIETAKKSLPDYKVVMQSGSLFTAIQEELKRLKVTKIGFEDEYLSVAMFTQLKRLLDGVEFIPVSKQLSLKRAIKTEEEISRIAAAQVVAQKALTKAVNSLRPGITEREFAAEILYEMQMLGADDMSFDIIVAFGANSAMPHYKTGNKKLEKNDIILVDMGAKMNGYCSDMTRTFSIGDVGEKLKELHQLVLEAQLLAIKGIKAGITGREADAIAREFFKANGYDKEFGHSLGHGVGIEVHENPRLSVTSDDILQPNMVVTVEPGLYIEGIGGVRIEDMLVIKEDGNLNLTNMNKNLNL